MSVYELPTQANEFSGAGPIIDSPPELMAEIVKIREEEPQLSRARQELTRRCSDGIEIIMFWVKSSDQVVVSVEDTRLGESFELHVEKDRAKEAYEHPFGYRASGQLATSHALIHLPKAS